MNQVQYDAYIAGQEALGRDTSEYKPEIRLRWAELVHAARDYACGAIPWTAALHIAEDAGFTDVQLTNKCAEMRLRLGGEQRRYHKRRYALQFGEGFGAQKMPLHERLLARMRGFDA